MPWYFQAVQGTSAINSGVRFLSFAAPQTIAALVAGVLAAVTGHYLAVMVVGTILCAVGSGLLILLGVDTSTVTWAAYMALAGLGDGLAVNMPYTAIQVIFERDADVFVGNAIATFGTLAGGGVGIGVGANLLRNSLLREIPARGIPIPPDAIISAGPLALPGLATSPAAAQSLREAFASAVSATNVGSAAAVGLSVFAVLGIHWLNLKTVAKKRAEKERTINEAEKEKTPTRTAVAAAQESARSSIVESRKTSVVGRRLPLPAYTWDDAFV